MRGVSRAVTAVAVLLALVWAYAIGLNLNPEPDESGQTPGILIAVQAVIGFTGVAIAGVAAWLGYRTSVGDESVPLTRAMRTLAGALVLLLVWLGALMMIDSR